MSRIVCEIEESTDVGDAGNDVPCVVATCTRCDHETTSFGTSDRSVRRCLALMRDECPMGQANYYVSDDEE